MLWRWEDAFTYRAFLISMFSLLFSLSGLGMAAQGATDRDKARLLARGYLSWLKERVQLIHWVPKVIVQAARKSRSYGVYEWWEWILLLCIFLPPQCKKSTDLSIDIGDFPDDEKKKKELVEDNVSCYCIAVLYSSHVWTTNKCSKSVLSMVSANLLSA